MNNFSVCAIIVTYNPDLTILSRQFESIINQVQKIVYVDNFSNNRNQLIEFINIQSVNFPDIIDVFFNSANLGLGFAHNLGISKAINEFNSSHILLLDHDSVLDHDFISNIYQTFSEINFLKLKIAAIGPAYFNEKTGEVYPITKYWGPFIERIIPQDKAVEASFLISSGCVIPTEVIKSVGLMDEGLFVDYVDVEWSFRAKNKGYSLYVSPHAKMSHIVGDQRMAIFGRTISVHSPLRRYYLSRNSIHMLRISYIPVGYKIREITFTLLRLLVFLALSNDRIKYLKYCSIGFIDGIKGKIGLCSILKSHN